MALESATYIDGLVATNPVGSDPVAQADDHLRLLKSVLKSTFPNISGAITATQAQLNSPFPVGGVILWSGAAAAIPSGWVLCDGNNSTPDLRSKFVTGAGGVLAVGATGGASTVTLAEANLPSHTHTATSTFTGSALAAHSHAITDAGHTHVTNTSGPDQRDGGPFNYTSNWTAGSVSGSSTTGITINAASAGTPSGTIATTNASVGSGTAVGILPPYYALCYIMKT